MGLRQVCGEGIDLARSEARRKSESSRDMGGRSARGPLGVATGNCVMPTHTSEGMTPVPQAATLSPQLLLSFGPVEATWRGLFVAGRLDELPRRECACVSGRVFCEPVFERWIQMDFMGISNYCPLLSM